MTTQPYVEPGTIAVSYPAPWVFVGRIAGYYAASQVEQYMHDADKAIRAATATGRKAHIFHAWWGMTGYDTSCRQIMTEWGQRHRKHVAAHHVLVSSKLVAMGVAVVGMLLGKDYVRAYTSPEKYQEQIRAAVRGE